MRRGVFAPNPFARIRGFVYDLAARWMLVATLPAHSLFDSKDSRLENILK